MSKEDTKNKPPKKTPDHLQRNLTNRHIQLIAIGGAIGTGLFMGSGKGIHTAGPSILFVYIILGLVLFVVMRAMGEILLHKLEYKSFQDFCHDLIGPWAGFFIGWSYWICWVLAALADMFVVTKYFDFWFHNKLVSIAATAILLVALLASNILTVKLFGELEFWFAIIKVVAVLALIILGGLLVVTGFTSPDGVSASFTHLWDRGGMFPHGFDGFLSAFQIAIYSFIGTELIGTTAAETKDPHKTLPKAVNAVPSRIMIFYVGALAVIMSITPHDLIDPKNSPFVTVFNLVGLVAAASIMNFVVLTSASSSANSGIFSTSRMLFGMSENGDAPRFFDKLSGRSVPLRALLVSGILLSSFVPILLAGEEVTNAFDTITGVSAALAIFFWSMILVAYIIYRKRNPEAHKNAKFKLFGASWTPWVALAFFAFMVVVLGLGEGTRIALVLAPIWFIVLGIAWFIIKSRQKK